MELLYDNKIINEIVSKLFRHRRNDYSEFHLCTRLLIQKMLFPATTFGISFSLSIINNMKNFIHLFLPNQKSLPSASCFCTAMGLIV